MCRAVSLLNGWRSGSGLRWNKQSGRGRKPSPHRERGIEMSIHDIAIMLAIYVATIGAGALVGCVIDRMRK